MVLTEKSRRCSVLVAERVEIRDWVGEWIDGWRGVETRERMNFD